MKLGFIGTGNMASAIMGGIIKNNVVPAEQIYLSREENVLKNSMVFM